MNEKDFVAFCRKTVAELKNAELEKIGVKITEDDVRILRMEEILNHRIVVLETKITEVSGSEYYEITYNGDKNIAYVDEYLKVAQRVVVM